VSSEGKQNLIKFVANKVPINGSLIVSTHARRGGCLQVRWIRALYCNFSEFTADQERLISLGDGARLFDYVEGFVVAAEGLINNWRSSFSPQNPVKLNALKHHTGVLYCLEVTKNYNDDTVGSVDQVRSLFVSAAFLSLVPVASYARGFAGFIL
jgi:hypothetical protein